MAGASQSLRSSRRIITVRTDCCMVETSQHSQREDYETPLKGRSEPSHGTLWEKASENKKTLRPDRLASLRWAVLCLPEPLAAGKVKNKHVPADNWMGIFNRLSCDLNAAGSQALARQSSEQKRSVRSEATWPEFPWRTCLSPGWWAWPVFSKACCSLRILRPGCCLLLVSQAGRPWWGEPRSPRWEPCHRSPWPARRGAGVLLPTCSCVPRTAHGAGWEGGISAAWCHSRVCSAEER